ncbi:MAG: helix-turn-helix domain-containing protein [Crenarchaeota archaeon]|nr:helix-turn-helix domain-containing protein [Thermoproteota archaeon]
MDGEWRQTLELLEATRRVLARSGYSVSLVNYPRQYEKRSIDVLATREGESILLKISTDIGSLNAREARELRRLSLVLGASPLLVALREHGEELEDIVAYERYGVYALTPSGLEAALRNELYVARRHGDFYMRIDGARLREAREARGMSLGDLASIVGVTRRSIYEYERSTMDVSLTVALKILDVFGEEVFKPIPVLSESGRLKQGRRPRRPSVDNKLEATVVTMLQRSGVEVVHTRHTPVDIASKTPGEGRAVVVVEHSREKPSDMYDKCMEASKLASGVKAKAILLSSKRELGIDAEGLGMEVARRPEEVASLVLGDKHSQRA